jgi:hypothetical protein
MQERKIGKVMFLPGDMVDAGHHGKTGSHRNSIFPLRPFAFFAPLR